MIDPVMTLYNHVKRNPLHLGKSLATIAKHRDAGRFDPDLALRLLRNNVTDNVRLMVHDRFTIRDVAAVAVMILADSAPAMLSAHHTDAESLAYDQGAQAARISNK